jgi:hypothetical protein
MSVQTQEFEIRELHARQECEGLGVIGKTGRPDHGFNSILRECFDHLTVQDKHRGVICWQKTLVLRKKLIAGYEKRKERG